MTIEPFLTAAQAYPAFERAVAASTTRIDAGFRVFDPKTRLHSDEARAIGETWYDLLAAKLAQGVEISLTIGDFDPVMALDLHRGTWASIRPLTSLTNFANLPAGSARLTLRALPAPGAGGDHSTAVFRPWHAQETQIPRPDA